ncbi:MAG: aminotransferase class I/II-fold pyridoxal phosphate-dependent enzyme [Chloroflexota bacterium]
MQHIEEAWGLKQSLAQYQADGYYFYLEATEELLPNGRVCVQGRGEMIMLGSYSYLGLIGHPQINAAAKAAVDKYGTGTHGVRFLAGSLDLHNELEARIADFKGAETAVVMSSGYVTNLTTISSLMGKGDTVICDKLNHASIVDGCRLSQANFVRFRHNDMDHLEFRLKKIGGNGRKLVVADAVFSMDGDIIDLPAVHRLCRNYDATLMIDEAHAIGVLGATGHGIEEHFGMPADSVDIKMGTLSKAIPSVGGYIAANVDVVTYLKHAGRAFIYSAALPPAQTAAAYTALDVIEAEPERIAKLQNNYQYFAERLRAAGFDLLCTEAAIVPIVCGSLENTLELAKYCQDRGIFVQAIIPPVVPVGSSRLRACVSATHSRADIDYCIDTLVSGGLALGIL